MKGRGLVHARDLRDGAPVWNAGRRPACQADRLTEDVATDVLVIGAGISGALVAEHLSEAGLGVVVVDRRGPFRGSTAASTALLQYELDTPLTTLSRKRGPAAAERIWTRSWLAVAALVARAKRLGIEAEIQAREALYLAGTELDARAIAREAARRRRTGFEVELLGRGDLRERFGLRRSAAILGFGDHVADPRKLTAGFLRVARSRGARLFAPVEVVRVEETARGIVATTEGGPRVRAGHVVYANWSGNFGTSPDGAPSVGPVPGHPRSYAILGYGGNGITFSMLGAQLIRGAITDEPDADQDLFALR